MDMEVVSQAHLVTRLASSLSLSSPSTVVIIALNGARSRLCHVVHQPRQRSQNPAQFLQFASGLSGVSAVPTARMDLTTTSSGRGSGSRSRLPSMVAKNASTTLQLTSLMRSLATNLAAQLIALANGDHSMTALQRNQFQEVGTVVVVPKQGGTPSHVQRHSEAENAATATV